MSLLLCAHGPARCSRTKTAVHSLTHIVDGDSMHLAMLNERPKKSTFLICFFLQHIQLPPCLMFRGFTCQVIDARLIRVKISRRHCGFPATASHQPMSYRGADALFYIPSEWGEEGMDGVVGGGGGGGRCGCVCVNEGRSRREWEGGRGSQKRGEGGGTRHQITTLFLAVSRPALRTLSGPVAVFLSGGATKLSRLPVKASRGAARSRYSCGSRPCRSPKTLHGTRIPKRELHTQGKHAET